ncbi:hypothetical protein Y919_02995 [Caloranaerobacter azorensis H53214]|uniref:Uncharacterized protein n=1 Tax=Caloranaerobacter azorensis H53214 TaxID=1156417 RepID=A0A096BJN4_9FIRM|nr:hypothetical protein [Caloranaerobacter azorensis]KGG81042.1 hypothetical protein Y919_02995 [Caloranaerobacter azorensis H53214]
MNKSRIDYVMKRLRRKIWINRIQQYMAYAFCIGATGMLILIIIGHAYPIVYLLKKAVNLVLTIVLLGILTGLLHRPSLKYTAYVGDELGFENRLTTYMEYREIQDSVVEAFRYEVEEALEQRDIVDEYSFYFPWKIVIIGFFILILSAGLYFIPSNGMRIAEQREEIHKELKEESKKVEQTIKELKQNLVKDDIKSRKFMYKITSSLQELEKRLNKSFDYKEAAFHVSNVQNEIKKCCRDTNKEYERWYTGIFNGVEENHQILKQAVDNDDMSRVFNILKDKHFTIEEKKKILENIESIKSRFSDNEYINSITNKMKIALEKENTGKILADILKEEYYRKKELDIAQRTIIKLQNMKERLMDKASIDGFKSFDGDKKSADFERGGESELSRDGELSNINSEEFAMGSQANKLMGNADGLGGGSRETNGNSEKVKNGEILKEDTATRLEIENKNISYIRGSFQETGEIIDKKVRQAVGDIGELEELHRFYSSFKEEGINYVLKQGVPLEYRQLVINYFDRLIGGK